MRSQARWPEFGGPRDTGEMMRVAHTRGIVAGVAIAERGRVLELGQDVSCVHVGTIVVFEGKSIARQKRPADAAAAGERVTRLFLFHTGLADFVAAGFIFVNSRVIKNLVLAVAADPDHAVGVGEQAGAR